MKDFLKNICTSRKICSVEITIASITMFIYGIVDYDENPMLFFIIAVLIPPFFLFLLNSFWETCDNGLAPQKFSSKNLIIRDIILRYTTKFSALLLPAILFFWLFDETNILIFLALGIVTVVLFVLISIFYFKENLKIHPTDLANPRRKSRNRV
jgi:hypothetical protein